MSKFVEYIFEDVLTLKYGKNQRKVVDKNGDYPILGTGGIMGYANQYLYDKPSVLIGRKGTINKPVYMDTPFWTIDTLFYTEVNEEKVNPKYLYYRFLLINFLQFNEATGVPSLKTHTLNKIPLKIHKSVDYQQKIAKVLSDLDAKIELNNRINAELEAMAKLVYDYWFVQFDFPNEEGQPYKSSGGEMVYSAVLKREVPLGWEVATLSDIGEIIGGSTPSRKVNEYFTNNGTAWITPKDLSLNKGKKYITKGLLDVSEAGIKAASLKIMPKGTVLLSTRAPIGYIAISRKNVTTNQGFKSFVPNKGYSTTFIYYTVQLLIKKIEANASGSTFKEISTTNLKRIETVLPPNLILERFSLKIESIVKQQDLLEQENQELQGLRDWLLPMLMNGQVSIND